MFSSNKLRMSHNGGPSDIRGQDDTMISSTLTRSVSVIEGTVGHAGENFGYDR